MSTLRYNLDALLHLQKIDSDRDKQARLRPTTDSINSIQSAAATAQAEFQTRQTELSRLNGSLKDAELELAGIEKRIKDYESKMRQGIVTNTREVMNFEKEFNQLNRQRSALDDKILSLMEQVDMGTVSLAAAEARASGLDQDLKTAKTTFHNGLSRVEAELGRLNGERAKAAESVDDPTLLKRYEALRVKPGKGGIGIAKTVNNTCGACHMQVGTMAVAQAESGSQLTVCENCGRLMA